MAAAAPKKKKGMSLEEKREAMLAICHESKDVFNLKELEKLGTKAGVVTQTIKDVVQSLVDDRLVEMEKIGSANFYWSFPSKAKSELLARTDALRKRIEEEEAATQALQTKLAALTSAREDTAQRTADLAKLATLQAEKAALEAELKTFADSDPDTLVELKKHAAAAKAGADRWTDNVWVLKSYLVNKCGKEPKEADKILGITEDFDYVK